MISASWRASTGQDWAIMRELTVPLVRRWFGAYAWVIAGLLVTAVGGWVGDRRRVGGPRPARVG